MEEHDFKYSNVLLKFSSKREYLEDLTQGLLYMNESGYFRGLEDTYRGDPNDGKSPVSLEKYQDEKLIIGPADGSHESIEIPISHVSNFKIGFHGDDKIPLYCCTMLTGDILERDGPNTFRFCQEFIAEMKQFGDYVVWIDGEELIRSVERYAEEHGLLAMYGPVEYLDILSVYDLELLNERRANQYEPFFKKDQAYRWQNEWRLLFLSQNGDLIGEQEHHLCVQLPPLKWAHIFTIKDLEENRIEVNEQPD